MSGTRDYPPDGGEPEDWGDDPQVRAGEYVLGVLDTAEAGQVRLAAMTDLDLADAIVRWEVRFAPLADLAPRAAPPAELWSRIEASIQPSAASNVVPMRGRSNLWRSTGLWRTTTAAALALAAAFAAVAYIPREAPETQVAALVPTNGRPAAFIAQVRADGSVVLTALSPDAVPPNRDLQLWLLPPNAQRPQSLGLLPASGRTVSLPGPQAVGAQLLISLEPQGGSPTNLPTGPVLYGGALNRT